MTFDELIEQPVYGVPQAEKERILTAELNELGGPSRMNGSGQVTVARSLLVRGLVSGRPYVDTLSDVGGLLT